MTKLCFMCLGCVKLEDKGFEGVYKCENVVRYIENKGEKSECGSDEQNRKH